MTARCGAVGQEGHPANSKRNAALEHLHACVLTTPNSKACFIKVTLLLWDLSAPQSSKRRAHTLTFSMSTSSAS